MFILRGFWVFCLCVTRASFEMNHFHAKKMKKTMWIFSEYYSVNNNENDAKQKQKNLFNWSITSNQVRYMRTHWVPSTIAKETAVKMPMADRCEARHSSDFQLENLKTSAIFAIQDTFESVCFTNFAIDLLEQGARNGVNVINSMDDIGCCAAIREYLLICSQLPAF